MDERVKRIKELFLESEKRNGELSHENFELKKRIAELEKINIVHLFNYLEDYFKEEEGLNGRNR